jgi:hypothetical protein
MAPDVIRTQEAVPTARFLVSFRLTKEFRLLNTCFVMERGIDGRFLKCISAWIM